MKSKKIQLFLSVANSFAGESHCRSNKVGCVIAKDERIIATGYNGTVAGTENCSEHFGESFEREKHHEWANKYEIHAEMNALMFAVKNGISVEGASLFSTLQPCMHCMKNILQAGIREVYFLRAYDKFEENDYVKLFSVYQKVDLV